MSFNLATILREAAAARPDAPALHADDRTWSYRDLDDHSAAVAGGLLGLGLARGDRVAIQLPNTPAFVIAYLAALRAGLITVPMNPMLRSAEVGHQVRDSGAKVLITRAEDAPTAIDATGNADHDVTIVTVGTPARSLATGTTGLRTLDDLFAATPADEIAPTSAEDTAVVIYTSGTTGQPKGAELTHFQLFMNCSIAGEQLQIQPTDTLLAALPLFHVFGLSSVLNAAMRYGASTVLVPTFDPATVLETMTEHEVTLFTGVPTMFVALTQASAGADQMPTSLRLCISGGAPMPLETLHAFEHRFSGARILEGYGSTESASVVCVNPNADERRIGSIGRPIWGVEVRLVDEKGQVIETADEVGELQFRGHNVTRGYWANPTATAETIKNGWYASGDLATRDADGFYYIVDRKKDVVLRGGYNVYPREVEEVLYQHPAVAEAAVIGRPDARLGEEVVAVVTLRADAPHPTSDDATQLADSIKTFVKERVAPYKYPREVRIIDVLPKSANGKILKRALR